MPFRVTFALDLFRGEKERSLTHASLNVLLDTLYKLDCLYLKQYPKTVGLYQSSIVYMEEPPGQEEWQDIPTCLRLGMGDCLPLTTRLLRHDGTLVPLALICPGDRVMADGVFTAVTASAATGHKPILSFLLGNGRVLRVSPDHRVFLGTGVEIRASKVRLGDRLLAPQAPIQVPSRTLITRDPPDPEVLAIEEEPAEACGDLTTASGTVYIPDADVVVHNCEDLACWRAAELTVQRGVPAVPFFQESKRPDGTYLFHILVRRSDGTVEDPSRFFGMR